MAPIRVLVCGAAGRMGRTTVSALHAQDDIIVVGAVDLADIGEDAGALAGVGDIGVPITASLRDALAESRPDVMVDFTSPAAVMNNLRTALPGGTACVVGTTGLTQEDLDELEKLCGAHGTTVIVAPNFSLGANLMMHFAATAAKYLDHAEIVELHHEGKKDAPSGTALLTAHMMAQAHGEAMSVIPTEHVKLDGTRGGDQDGVRIHAVRLPGLLAHQVVIFGGLGETLTIRHDTIGRESFMPGLLLAVRKTREVRGLTYGLTSLLT
ncbi:MAG: 4-hydroxy-tetrahydrodipicolinate reductase [Armatimonadota bacterium]